MSTALNPTVKDIYLHGPLGRKFGRHHRFAVSSAAEAVRALCALVGGFKQYLLESGDRGMKFHVFLDNENLTEEQLRFPCGKACIRFAPVLEGAKSGALAAIAGVVLIVVGVFLMFTPFAAFAPYVIGAGVGLLSIGVAQMLAPHPKDQEKDKADDRPSYSFNGPVNTQAQGAAVGVLYGGPMVVGSAVISASISTKDGVYVPTQSGGGSTSYGGGGSIWAQAIRAAIEQNETANP